MPMVILADDAVFRTALQTARGVGRAQSGAPGALHAPLPDAERGWVDRLWAKVEHALNTAWLHGREAAQEAIQEVHEDVAELTKELGTAARAVRALVIERVSSFVQTMIQGLLARVQSSLKIGDKEMPIRGVKIEQTLKMSGSLKASLEEICEFVADGELSLSADYGSGDAPAPP